MSGYICEKCGRDTDGMTYHTTAGTLCGECIKYLCHECGTLVMEDYELVTITNGDSPEPTGFHADCWMELTGHIAAVMKKWLMEGIRRRGKVDPDKTEEFLEELVHQEGDWAIVYYSCEAQLEKDVRAFFATDYM